MSVINRPYIHFRATVSEAMNEEYSDWLCLYVIKSVCQCQCVCVCESQGGRPGLPSQINLCVSVDVKQHFNVCVMCVSVCVCHVCVSEGERVGKHGA